MACGPRTSIPRERRGASHCLATLAAPGAVARTRERGARIRSSSLRYRAPRCHRRFAPSVPSCPPPCSEPGPSPAPPSVAAPTATPRATRRARTTTCARCSPARRARRARAVRRGRRRHRGARAHRRRHRVHAGHARPPRAGASRWPRWSPSAPSGSDMPLLAERITVSQEAEIELHRAVADRPGRRRCPTRGRRAITPSTSRCPAWRRPSRLAALEQARGPAFDALFLELMIAHHQGALTMVDELYAAGGGSSRRWTARPRGRGRSDHRDRADDRRCWRPRRRT